DIEAAVKTVNSFRDVIAAAIMGKGYLEIAVEREKAARYGITVEDIQNEIEVALGGRVITFTIEKRDRYPVRIRYARAYREDEESVRRLLISPGGMAAPAATAIPSKSMNGAGMEPTAASPGARGEKLHQATPEHASKKRKLIPLSAVATVRIVEGPAMIRSENSQLMNHVTLMVRGR